MPNDKRETERVFGKQLREGDTIKVWWSPSWDTIVHLSPYVGSIARVFEPEGAQIAAFALNNTGMTIENGAFFERVTTKRSRRVS